VHRHALKAVNACLLVFLAGVSFSATAEDDPGELVKYRQNVMKSIGGHMGALASLVRGRVDFQQDMLVHARAVESATSDIARLFPKGSNLGETNAKEAIWKDWDDFRQHAKETYEKAAAFRRAAENGNKEQIGSRFKALGRHLQGVSRGFSQGTAVARTSQANHEDKDQG
jgi:cytochrome c556